MVEKNKNKESKEIESFTAIKFDSLIEAIDIIIMSDEGHRDLEYNEFRGSSAWKDPLALYLAKVYPESIIKPERGLKGVFMWGTAIHEYLQKRLDLTDVEGEIKYNTDNMVITAHCDGVYKGNRLIELKSANRWAFQHRVNNAEAAPHHIEQANLMAFLKDLPLFTIMYIDKGCSNKFDDVVAMFTYNMDRTAGTDTIAKHHSIMMAVRAGKPPKANPLSWECRYCEVREKCRELGLKKPKTVKEEVMDAIRDDKNE